MAFQLHRFCFLNHLVQFFSSDRYQRFRYTLTAAVAVKLGRHGIVDHKVHVSKQFFKNLLRSQALVKECGNGIDFCQTLLQFFNDFLIADRPDGRYCLCSSAHRVRRWTEPAHSLQNSRSDPLRSHSSAERTVRRTALSVPGL